jgi:rhodanese-related sulfurtransferase
VLYCDGDFRSALAADNLQRMGYENVFSLDGGCLRGWSRAGCRR